MAQRSIVDRVLMLAAGICAAALVWQLTVLLTSKSRSTPATAVVASNVVPEPTEAAPPPASASLPTSSAPVAAAPSTPAASAIRVVYAGTEPTTKSTLKASDPPTDAVEPAAASPAAPQTLSEPSSQTTAASAPSEPASASPVADAPSAPGPASATLPGAADETASTGPAASVPAASPGASGRLATAEPPPLVDDDKPAAAPASGALDLNHASAEALNHLKGAGHIGQAIVSHRPYRSVEDLVKKRVLRRGVYEQIKQQVVAQ